MEFLVFIVQPPIKSKSIQLTSLFNISYAIRNAIQDTAIDPLTHEFTYLLIKIESGYSDLKSVPSYKVPKPGNKSSPYVKYAVFSSIANHRRHATTSFNYD